MEKTSIHEIEAAEIIVGIPSYNEADNIAFVADQCNMGLQKYFPDRKSVIINVDNCSPDNTRMAFLNSMNTLPKLYISTDPGVLGKGNNFYNLFKEAVQLKASAVVVVDADLKSITPEWVLKLASPVLDGKADYITPIYSRHKYDGTITNNLCYPLIYGLFGRDIRQPIGGDFALSGELAAYYLKQNWDWTTYQYGIDIFMTMHALLGKFTAGQVHLGAKKHKPSAPKLGPMFTQVVGTMFNTIINNPEQWMNITGLQDVPFFGPADYADPQQLHVDAGQIQKNALREYYTNERAINEVLSSPLDEQIQKMFGSKEIAIDMNQWTRIVYDFIAAYATSTDKGRVVEALKALYFGRVYSFINETIELEHKESEQQIADQARCFLDSKPYLIRKFQK